MKLKKYCFLVLSLVLMMTINTNKIYAAANKPDSDSFCYYLNPNNTSKPLKLFVEVKYGEESTNTDDLRIGSNMITIIKYNNITKVIETPMLNWASHFKRGSGKGTFGIGSGTDPRTTNGTTFPVYYPNTRSNPVSLWLDTPPNCPKYIVIELNKTATDEYFGWGTEDESLAKQAVKSETTDAEYAYASNFKDGKQITRETFFGNLEQSGLIGRDESVAEYTCKTLEKDLFGSKTNPTQLRYYIDLIMQYIRIIVPILVITLGTLDFAKAVLAGKEDEMKKAQNTFVRRLIAGVAVFFVPLLVDIVMELADIVWAGNYTSCKF